MSTLVERASEEFGEQDAKVWQRRLQDGEFDLDDFIEQIGKVRQMGPISQIVSMIPGLSSIKNQINVDEIDDDFFKQFEAIVCSMTPGGTAQAGHDQRLATAADREGQRHDAAGGQPVAEPVQTGEGDHEGPRPGQGAGYAGGAQRAGSSLAGWRDWGRWGLFTYGMDALVQMSVAAPTGYPPSAFGISPRQGGRGSRDGWLARLGLLVEMSVAAPTGYPPLPSASPPARGERGNRRIACGLS